MVYMTDVTCPPWSTLHCLSDGAVGMDIALPSEIVATYMTGTTRSSVPAPRTAHALHAHVGGG